MSKKLKPDIPKQKQKWQLFGSLPELSGPIIKICSNKEASVDGCKGVVDYYENLIKLRISGGTVTFTGTELCITSFTSTTAVVSGKLQNIEFSVM